MGRRTLGFSRAAGASIAAGAMSGLSLLRSRIPAWQGYLAVSGLGVFLYLTISPFKGSGLLYNTLGLSSWIAVIVGIRRNKPSYALPWWLFAFGLCLYWMGDVYTYSYPQYILHHEVPFPSIGDAIYLTVYPALMVGLLLLVRRRNPQGSRNTLIDAAILTLGLSLLSWVLLITPYLHDASLGLLPKIVSVAYPIGDILLLAAVIRLILDSGPRRPAFYLLSASIVSLLATDFVYGVMTLDSSFHHQLLLDLGWISFLLLWGAAALHPSMVELQEPNANREAKLTHMRLGLLTGASLIAPVCILLKELHRGDFDLIVIICASIVLFGLVVMRMGGLVRQQERSVVRERLLSSFGTALVSCATREEMQRVRPRGGGSAARASRGGGAVPEPGRRPRGGRTQRRRRLAGANAPDAGGRGPARARGRQRLSGAGPASRAARRAGPAAGVGLRARSAPAGSRRASLSLPGRAPRARFQPGAGGPRGAGHSARARAGGRAPD